jgi:hypothetical protein
MERHAACNDVLANGECENMELHSEAFALNRHIENIEIQYVGR